MDHDPKVSDSLSLQRSESGTIICRNRALTLLVPTQPGRRKELYESRACSEVRDTDTTVGLLK